MMPRPHHERQNTATQYRWFSTGRDTARLKVTDHAPKLPATSALAAYSEPPTSSGTTRNTAKAQAPTHGTAAANLKSP